MQRLVLNRFLYKGMSGSDVLEIQRTLVGWGSKNRPVILDCEFGPGMEEAVMRFQKAHNIESAGVVDEATLDAIEKEISMHPFDLKQYKCNCGVCNGFGSGRYQGEFMPGKPHVEAYNKYEYPGIDVTLMWAVRALMHRSGIPKIKITSGYRCWDHNGKTGRTSTNHMGKAVDFFSVGGGDHNGNSKDKIECSECRRIRNIGIEECGFQPGWSRPGRVSFEMPHHGAYTWIHIDTRCISQSKRRHVIDI